jgi:orotidine-5'-phosphate decarboxylase
MKDKNIVVALDFAEEKKLFELVDQIDPSLCRLKVGKELFTRFGPEMVKSLQGRGFDIFLDLKFHDIPSTVAKAVAAAADLGVWMVNVHASGGSQMMIAANKALEPFAADKPLLIAVTVLTSMSNEDLAAMQLPEARVLVPRLAKMAFEAGLDGVVSSAQEAHMIKEVCSSSFLTVTPGIRPQGASLDDQQRVLTPAAAVEQGADYLVVGRPITQNANPLAALQQIKAELDALR